MALTNTNLTFMHLFDSITPNYPTSGLTKTNPTGLSDPSISGNVATFGTGSGGVGVAWAKASGTFLTAGTGDFTIAIRGKFTSTHDGLNSMVMLGNTGARTMGWCQGGPGHFCHRLFDATSSLENNTQDNTWVSDTLFTWVVKRASGVVTSWVNGSTVTWNNSNGSLSGWNFSGTYEDIVLGSRADAAAPFDGTLVFVAFWNDAQADADCALIDATTLRAVLPSTGPAIPIMQNNYQMR